MCLNYIDCKPIVNYTKMKEAYLSRWTRTRQISNFPAVHVMKMTGMLGPLALGNLAPTTCAPLSRGIRAQTTFVLYTT